MSNPKKSILQTFLSRQDTSTTISSFSTSCSNLDTSEIIISSTSKRQGSNGSNNNNVRTREIYHEGLSAFGDEKTIKRLKSHYYPEGGWGYMIALIACIIHMTNNGLQNSFSVFSIKIHDIFATSQHSAGDLH
jgi:hypothetical protein